MHYGSKEQENATTFKLRPGSKKITAVKVDTLSYQNMTPEQQAAHDKLMKPGMKHDMEFCPPSHTPMLWVMSIVTLAVGLTIDMIPFIIFFHQDDGLLA